jgi:hypothetical protein
LVAATVIEFELPIIPGTVWRSRPLPWTQYGDVPDPPFAVSVRLLPAVVYVPFSVIVGWVAWSWHEHPEDVVEHVAMVPVPPSPLKSACSWSHVSVTPPDVRHELGRETAPLADPMSVIVKVPLVLNVRVPLTDADSLKEELGHCCAKGLYWLPMHSLVTLHVPTMFPPQAVNDEQFGPPPLLVLPEHPDATTHATNPKAFQENRMTPSWRAPYVTPQELGRDYCFVPAIVVVPEPGAPIIPAGIWMSSVVPCTQ